MNKRTTRSFAFGILISVLLMGAYYFSVNKKTEISVDKAKEIVSDDGFVILTKEQYENIRKEKSAPKEVPSINEEKENTTSRHSSSEEEKEKNFYELEIKSGMNSQQIADMLQEENIVEDAGEFETYLEEYGYNTKIQPGKFKLSAGMSYKEMAKIITKS